MRKTARCRNSSAEPFSAISALAGGLGLVFFLLGWLVAGLRFSRRWFFHRLFVANVPEGSCPR